MASEGYRQSQTRTRMLEPKRCKQAAFSSNTGCFPKVLLGGLFTQAGSDQKSQLSNVPGGGRGAPPSSAPGPAPTPPLPPRPHPTSSRPCSSPPSASCVGGQEGLMVGAKPWSTRGVGAYDSDPPFMRPSLPAACLLRCSMPGHSSAPLGMSGHVYTSKRMAVPMQVAALCRWERALPPAELNHRQ